MRWEHYIWLIAASQLTAQLTGFPRTRINMSSSFYIESLIQSSKPKTTVSDARHTYEPTVPCSCCWTPSQSEASGLCQLCIPPSASAVHPFLHAVRGAAITEASSLYSAKEFLKAEHAHLSPHYASAEEERLRLVSYGNCLSCFTSQLDTC